MFKTSRDRGYLVAGVAFLAVCCAIFQPVVFFAIFIALSVLGAVGVAFLIYDWIISADEVLAQEAEYRRERYQMTPSTPEKRGKYQDRMEADAKLNDLISRAAKHHMTPEEVAAQRASWGKQDMD
jgi:hypothetical protein